MAERLCGCGARHAVHVDDPALETTWTEYRVVCQTPEGVTADDAGWSRLIDKSFGPRGNPAEWAQDWSDHCDGLDDPESDYHSSCRPHHVESRTVTATAWERTP